LEIPLDCHEAFLFLEKRAKLTANPYSLHSKLGIIIFELRLNLKGMHKMNTHMENTCMFVEPNFKARVTPKVAIPPLLEKKKQNLKFVKFFKSAIKFSKYL
jgi:hypothetical protein